MCARACVWCLLCASVQVHMCVRTSTCDVAKQVFVKYGVRRCNELSDTYAVINNLNSVYCSDGEILSTWSTF